MRSTRHRGPEHAHRNGCGGRYETVRTARNEWLEDVD